MGHTARIVSDGDFSYSYGNVVSVYDGRGKAELTYNRSGFSVSVKDPLGNVSRICYNAFNAPVSVTDADGIVTKYAYNDAGLVARRKHLDGSETLTTIVMSYDAAGRMVREGSKRYTYGYLDKVLSVTDGDTTRTFTYHADGQLASANYGDSSESFAWNGLALIQRGDEQFINEPHVGGGNPVAFPKGTSYFNDALGTTVGSKSNGKYSAAVLSAFGENLANDSTDSQYFTGKPFVKGLGHAFWMRNYRAGLAKWQSADPMGYPDGWNQLAYCGNGVTSAVDLWGCSAVPPMPSLEDVQIYDIMKNKTFDERKKMTEATDVLIKILRRKLGTLDDKSRIVDGAWEVVETPLNLKYGEWHGTELRRWREVTWDDKEQFFELIKHEQIIPKSSFDIFLEDLGNVLSLASIPTIFGVSGVVMTAISASGVGITGYNIVFQEQKKITIGYTYEGSEFTRLKPRSETEWAGSLVIE